MIPFGEFLDEASGIAHLLWGKEKACKGKSWVGGAMYHHPAQYEKIPVEHRCKNCEKRAEKLRRAFPQKFQEVKENEVAANCAGAGNVDGIGVGPRGEPGVKPKRRKKKWTGLTSPSRS